MYKIHQIVCCKVLGFYQMQAIFKCKEIQSVELRHFINLQLKLVQLDHKHNPQTQKIF